MRNEIIIPLILKYQNHDKNSFLKIYEVFESLIVYYDRKMCCEDGKSELTLFLLELLKGLDLSRFKKDDSYSLQKYVAVAIRNRYIDISKKGRRIAEKLHFVAEVNVNFCERSEEKVIIEDIFSKLSYKQKQVLTYRYLYGYNDSETAKLMGISRQAVNGIKQRALNTLKNFYE